MHSVTQRWAPACGLSPAFCKTPSDLRVWVQSHFQTALLDGTPHYLGDLRIVFSTQNAGNESTSFPPCADSSGFWCSDSVMQPRNNVGLNE